MPTTITREFAEKISKRPVKAVEESAGCAEGDNIAGALKSLTLTTPDDSKVHLVYKTFSDVPFARQMVIDGRCFPVEIAVYSKMVPELNAIFEAKGLQHRIPVPLYYDGFTNDQDDYLVLEDLRPAGYKMANKYTGYSVQEMNVVLKALAVFHASTYNLVKYKGESWFENNAIPRESFFRSDDRLEERKQWMQMVQAYTAEVLEAADPSLAAAVKAKLCDVDALEVLSRNNVSTDVKHFPCVAHGDLWLNNIMVRYDDQGNPTDVKFIDFQQTRRGNVFEDLQNLFWSSTTPAFRKKHLYQSLVLYYNTFKKTLKDLDCPMPMGFSLGSFIDDFNLCAFPAFLFAGFAVPIQLGVIEMPPMGLQQGPPPAKEPEAPKGEEKKADVFDAFINGEFGAMQKIKLQSKPALERYLDICREFIELDPK